MPRMRWAAMAALLALASWGPAVAQTDPNGKTLTDMPAGAYKSDLGHTHVYFTYNHVGFSNSHGRFDKLVDGQFTYDPAHPVQSSVSILIDPASIDTNVPALDAGLRAKDFFDVEHFKELRFVSRSFQRTSERHGVLTGDLTMRGVTKPVTLEVTLNKFLLGKEPKFDRFGFSASGKLKRSDWGLGGVPLVGDEVTLEIDAEFTKVVN